MNRTHGWRHTRKLLSGTQCGSVFACLCVGPSTQATSLYQGEKEMSRVFEPKMTEKKSATALVIGPIHWLLDERRSEGENLKKKQHHNAHKL